MRLVATSDTHFPFDDRLIHAGDLMYTGYLDEWHARLESFKALPHKVKLYVPGNHDYHVQNYEGVAAAELRKADVTMLHNAAMCDRKYEQTNPAIVIDL